MVPARFETIASLPKLSSGKVDRKSLKLVPLSASRRRRRAGGAAHEDRGGPARGGQESAAAAADSVRRRFLHRSWRPLAAGGALHLDRAQDARRWPASPCRTSMRRARCAPCGEMLDAKGGSRARPRSVLRAAAFVAALSLRTGAGAEPSLHPRPCHRAMARRVRELHAADRRRRHALAGNPLLSAGLCRSSTSSRWPWPSAPNG